MPNTKRPPRGRLASRIDEITLAAFAVMLLVATVAVLQIGAAEALDRIGCSLNDEMNLLLAYPRPCH